MEHTGCSHRYHLAGSDFDNFCRLFTPYQGLQIIWPKANELALKNLGKSCSTHATAQHTLQDAEINEEFIGLKG